MTKPMLIPTFLKTMDKNDSEVFIKGMQYAFDVMAMEAQRKCADCSVVKTLHGELIDKVMRR